MFGSHLSIAGGMHNALLAARDLGMDCVQVFTKNQRQWLMKPVTQATVDLWKQHQRSTGIKATVSHDSYLINLAAPPGDIRRKSIAMFRVELVNCEMLGIPWLVTHPGAHVGQGEEQGLARVVEALDQIHAELPGLQTLTCLEITAGQGSALGHRFEHLRTIIEGVREPDRLAVCIDTAHMLAAGYDLTSAAGMKATLREMRRVLGPDRIKVVHVNDSKAPRGSRVDRHAHIGHGHVAPDAFEVLVNDARLKRVPKILETEKEDAPDGRPWDTVNLETLRRFVRRAGATRSPRRATG